MGNLANLSSTWAADVVQIEPADPVEGGPSGVDNAPHRNLAERTNYLKATLEVLATTVSGKAAASHTHADYAASSHTHTGVYALSAHTHDYMPLGSTAADSDKVDGYHAEQLAAYDLSASVGGRPGAAQKCLILVAARAFTVEATGHKGKCYTNPTAQADFPCKKNGTQFGVLRFATDGAFSLASFSAASFAPGDLLTIEAPSSQDATLADVGLTLRGTVA